MSWSVKIENLGKKYRRGEVHQSGNNFRESLMQAMKQAVSSLGGSSSPRSASQAPHSEEFWALRDIHLEIEAGHAIGVIGRNGAGKSTLLKILARITPPTTGAVRYRGRVAALLEVGTGFHRELTGRENVYLNGAILGMGRAEVSRKLDEIVAFSGVEEFLDTPVKFYSSGMGVRLAFAVAAHLDADILLVDEVLAVGDAAFQEKCIGKMRDVTSHSGRTVIFISHNMDAIHKLCSRTILIEKGAVALDGRTSLAVEQYLGTSELKKQRSLRDVETRSGSGEARYVEVELLGGQGRSGCEYEFDSPIRFRAAVDFLKPIDNPVAGYIIFSGKNTALVDARSHWDSYQFGHCEGRRMLEVTIPPLNFYPGIYTILLWISPSPTRPVMDQIHGAFAFRLIPPRHIPPGREFFDIWGAVHVVSVWKLLS